MSIHNFLASAAAALLLAACASPAPQTSRARQIAPASAVPRVASTPSAAKPGDGVASAEARRADGTVGPETSRRSSQSRCADLHVRPYIGSVDPVRFARAFSEHEESGRLAMRQAATDSGAWRDIQQFLMLNQNEFTNAGMGGFERLGFATLTVLVGEAGYAHPDSAERAKRMALAGDMVTSVMFKLPWTCVRAS